MVEEQDKQMQLEERLRAKEQERLAQSRRAAEVEQKLEATQRAARSQVQSAETHLSSVKAKFAAEHEKWVENFKRERATWERSLEENRREVAEQMRARFEAERQRQASKADQIRREHATLAANLSRKMDEAVGDVRDVMQASPMRRAVQRAEMATAAAAAGGGASSGSSLPSTPLSAHSVATGGASTVGGTPATGGMSASAARAGEVAEEQLERLRQVWQGQMEQEKARWQAQLTAGQEQTSRVSIRLASTMQELDSRRQELASVREQLREISEKRDADATALLDGVRLSLPGGFPAPLAPAVLVEQYRLQTRRPLTCVVVVSCHRPTPKPCCSWIWTERARPSRLRQICTRSSWSSRAGTWRGRSPQA
jgi:hypothetical protein